MHRRLTATDNRLAAVVLAAGGSVRLGRPKQLLRYRSRPLLVSAAALAKRAADAGVVVVLGDNRLRLRRTVNRHFDDAIVVVNTGWKDGLASSLRAGIASVPRKARAALILLVDQPKLSEADIRRLIACWRRHPGRPAAAGYRDRVGVPAIIPRRCFGRLNGIRGDVGARHVLRQMPDVSVCDMPSAALDIDTPSDLRMLRP